MEMKPKRTRKSLSKQVMESIEKIILDQKLQPGDALPTEQQISEELGVSKSSVREAIKMLEALGVVEIRRGLCTVISENPEQGYLNVFLSHLYLLSGSAEELREFRKIIEEAYTTQAIATATEADITAIREPWSSSAPAAGTARSPWTMISASTTRSCRLPTTPF